MSIRFLIHKSWVVSQSRVDPMVGHKANAATMAGLLLDGAGGDARRAMARVPTDSAGESRVYWSRVLGILNDVVEEERRGPRLAETGS